MKNNWIKALTFSLLLLGLLISMQYNTQQEALSSLAYQDVEDLTSLVRELNTRRSNLEDQYRDTIKNLNTLKENNSSQETLETLQKENNSLKIITGLTSVTGPGIAINYNSGNLMASDIIDILNELWLTGAEAIAVNKIRIHQDSTITEAGGTLYANGEDIGWPITISAIGDSATLEKGITFPGGIVDKLDTIYGIKPTITQKTDIILPASV